MPDEEPKSSDPTALWREWIAESQRQWSAAFTDTMSSEDITAQLNRFMDVQSFAMKNVHEVMNRSLAALNLPSRTDILELGERIHAIERRITAIELQLGAVQPQRDPPTRHDEGASTGEAPPRTKQPPEDYERPVHP